MKKLLTIFTVFTLVLLLTACDESVEQKTLNCIHGDEDFIAVFQEERIISISSNGDLLTRENDLQEIIYFEEGFKEMFGDDITMFEIMDELILYFEEQDDAIITCEFDTEMVKYITYSEDDDENVSIIVQNAARDGVLRDALEIENAAKIYCAQTTCSSNQELTWTQLREYTTGIDQSYYDFTNNSGIIATKSSGLWTVDMEADGIVEWELEQDSSPSSCDRDCIIKDLD